MATVMYRYGANDRGTSEQSVSFTIDIDTQPPVLERLWRLASATNLPGTTEAGGTGSYQERHGKPRLGSGTASDDGTLPIGSPAKINGEGIKH